MKDQREAVKHLLTNLNIELNMNSDPNIIQDIIKNDMMLSNCPAFMDVFKTEFETPVDLSELMHAMSQGFYESHPAIVEFIEHVNSNKIRINAQKHHHAIVRTLNSIYVLNRLVEEIHAKPYWGAEIFDYIFSLRKNYGIRRNSLLCLIDSYKISKNWFLAVKMASINFVIKRYIGRLNRNANRAFKNSGYFGQMLWRTLLNINILEASLSDALNKRGKNAKTGLILVMFNNVKMHNDSIMRYEHSQQWASLYQTWNLSFITHNLPHLDIMYPKLLAPVVVNAKPDVYIFNRVMALNLTFNWLLINIKKGRVDPIAIPQNKELADVWGAINLRYAKKLYKAETGEEFSGVLGVCKEYVRRLYGQFHLKTAKKSPNS
jgi:hypothetical protein